MTEGERDIIAYRFPFLIIAVENTRSQKALATARPYLSGGVRYSVTKEPVGLHHLFLCVPPPEIAKPRTVYIFDVLGIHGDVLEKSRSAQTQRTLITVETDG